MGNIYQPFGPIIKEKKTSLDFNKISSFVFPVAVICFIYLILSGAYSSSIAPKEMEIATETPLKILTQQEAEDVLIASKAVNVPDAISTDDQKVAVLKELSSDKKPTPAKIKANNILLESLKPRN